MKFTNNKTIIFSDNSLWGCLNFRGHIIKTLINKGYKVVIVAPQTDTDETNIVDGIVYEPIKMERTGNNPIQDIDYLVKIKKIYKKHNPSIIFHFTIKPNIYGTFAAKILGIPSVVMITGLGYVFANSGITSTIAKSLYSMALKYAKHAIFLNTDNYNLMVQRKMVTPEKSTLLKGGEGVDISTYNATALPNNEQDTFLMVARVLYDKGYTEFVEAAKANPKAKFQLIGSIDSNPKAVPAEVVENEKAIEYLGFMSHDKVIQYMSQCSCVVLPSYHEGLSITLTEAIAMGKPVICSDIAGCRETVDNEINGYTVPAKNGVALAEACSKFIALSQEQKAKMASESRKKAEKQFDVKYVVEVYENLINNLAK